MSSLLCYYLADMWAQYPQNSYSEQTICSILNWTDFQKIINTACLKDIKTAGEYFKRKHLNSNQLYKSWLCHNIKRNIVFQNSCLMFLHLICSFEC